MKRHNAIYNHLEASGILANGTPEEIATARRAYWKKYRKEWNKRKRQECKLFDILLTPQETTILATAAKGHTSPTNFIKQAALAAATGRSMTDKRLLGTIRQALVLYYGTIQTICDRHRLPNQVSTELFDHTRDLERKILDMLHHKIPIP